MKSISSIHGLADNCRSITKFLQEEHNRYLTVAYIANQKLVSRLEWATETLETANLGWNIIAQISETVKN